MPEQVSQRLCDELYQHGDNGLQRVCGGDVVVYRGHFKVTLKIVPPTGAHYPTKGTKGEVAQLRTPIIRDNKPSHRFGG